MAKRKGYEQAIEKAKQLILEAWPNKPEQATVDVYTWPDVKQYGLRVAEVSLSWKPPVGVLAGCSFMQSDVEGGNAIFHTERCILELADPENENDLNDAIWRMNTAIFGDHSALTKT